MAHGTAILGAGATLCDGRYRLERLIGTGGMASVWLGRDKRLDRPVAVKVLSDALAADTAYVRRFRREARLAAGLSHPNLVKVFDFEPEDRPALIMEYVEGGTLEDAVNHPHTADGVEALATQLLDALEHIHSAGIVHRDVKPANVLVAGDGRALLTDFGIAQPEDATRLTQTGQVLGTLSYLAPEVLEGERATPQSDLYSAGVVLRDHLADDSPAALRRLVERLTEREPELRPASARRALSYLSGSGKLATGRPAVGTRELAAPAPDAIADVGVGEPSRPSARSTYAARREYIVRPGHVLAGLAALAAVVAAVAIATGGDDGGGGTGVESAKPQTAGSAPEAPAPDPGSKEPASKPPPEASPDAIPPPSDHPDPAKGAEHNQKGYELLQSGDYDKAVKELEKALTYFPAEARTAEAFASDPNYAYALFNYGRALRLAGRPDDAIPVLEARLEIPDQTEAVQAELDQAKAGVTTASPADLDED